MDLRLPLDRLIALRSEAARLPAPAACALGRLVLATTRPFVVWIPRTPPSLRVAAVSAVDELHDGLRPHASAAATRAVIGAAAFPPPDDGEIGSWCGADLLELATIAEAAAQLRGNAAAVSWIVTAHANLIDFFCRDLVERQIANGEMRRLLEAAAMTPSTTLDAMERWTAKLSTDAPDDAVIALVEHDAAALAVARGQVLAKLDCSHWE